MYDEKSTNEIICGNCGSTIGKNTKFCGKCGNKNEFYEEEKATVKVETAVKAEKKPFKVPKLVVVVAVVALLGLFSFNVFAKTFFPDKYAKGAILNTIQAINKDSENYNGIPGIVPMLLKKEVSEKELYLEINNISDSYASSLLSGYGAKFILQSDVKNNTFKLNMGVLEDLNDLVNVDFYASPDGFSVNMPLLYDNPIGVNANVDLSEIEYDSYYDMRIATTIQARTFKKSMESKKAIEESLNVFSKDVLKLVKFEKSKNADDRYTAAIAGDDLLKVFKNNAIKLLDNENIIDIIVNSVYMEKSKYRYLDDDLNFEQSKEETMKNIEEAKEMINKIESEDFELDDITITLSVNSDDLVKSINIESSINEVGVELSSKFDYNKDWVDSEIDVDIDSYGSVNFSYEVSNSKNDKSKYRDTSFTVSESHNAMFNVSLKEEYNTSSKEYKNTVILAPEYEDDGFSMEINADYNGKDTLNFEDVVFGFYNYSFYEVNLEGYLKSKDIKSVDKAKFNNIEYINEMSYDELEDLEEDISSKAEKIFGNLY